MCEWVLLFSGSYIYARLSFSRRCPTADTKSSFFKYFFIFVCLPSDVAQSNLHTYTQINWRNAKKDLMSCYSKQEFIASHLEQWAVNISIESLQIAVIWIFFFFILKKSLSQKCLFHMYISVDVISDITVSIFYIASVSQAPFVFHMSEKLFLIDFHISINPFHSLLIHADSVSVHGINRFKFYVINIISDSSTQAFEIIISNLLRQPINELL